MPEPELVEPEPELPEPELPEPEPPVPEELEPEEPELVPLAETLPATTTEPPSKFTPPVLPPVLVTDPVALILCAVAVT